jgi:hypothetical protein
MLWTSDIKYLPAPFELEDDLEKAILDIQDDLFGRGRLYLSVKKLIGKRGKTQNIPDGYLIDLSSARQPALYLVEVELSRHDPLRHIAQQLLNFSLSFKSTPQKMKAILRDAIQASKPTLDRCTAYAENNGFGNIDYLLEQMIYGDNSFKALMIIDELDSELESILRSSLAFPVETLVVSRFRSGKGAVAYDFEPFLNDLIASEPDARPAVDPEEIDTVVVPARRDGFEETFLSENMWRAVRIHESMKDRIRFVAAYQVAPISAITHTAQVRAIEPWKDSGKYALLFAAPASEIAPLKLVPGGKVKPLQNLRYTSMRRLEAARNLDDVF